MNIDELTGLAVIAQDKDRSVDERRAAFIECDAARKTAKTGWSKIGLTTDQVQALKAELEPLGGSDAVASSSGTSEAAGGADGVTDGGFEASADELGKQTGRPSVEKAKAEADDAQVEASLAKADKKVAKAKAEGAGETRGGLTRLVESLLMDANLSYVDIMKAVVAQFPKCSTSARSIASVAAGMRRKGVDVPMRRVVAAVKPAKPAKADKEADAAIA